jgi:hypothetical protein
MHIFTSTFTNTKGQIIISKIKKIRMKIRFSIQNENMENILKKFPLSNIASMKIGMVRRLRGGGCSNISPY